MIVPNMDDLVNSGGISADRRSLKLSKLHTIPYPSPSEAAGRYYIVRVWFEVVTKRKWIFDSWSF